DTAYILRTGGIMLLITAGSLACAVASSYLSARIATEVGASLRRDVFARVEGFTLHEFDRFGTATLITRSTNDVTQVQNVAMMALRMMLMAPIMAIGGVVMAFSKDRPLTLTLAVAVPVLTLVIAFLASRAMPLFKRMQSKIDRLNLVLRESLVGIRVIRAFNRTPREEERFDEANRDITATYVKVNRLMAFLMPAMMMVMNVTSVAILWFGVARVDSGAMQMGSLIAFTQYAMQIMFSMLMMSLMFIMVPRAQAAAERIAEVLAVEPSIVDPAVPAALPAAAPGAGTAAKGEVEFRDVGFSYHGAAEPALRGVSFRALAGKTTAVVGSTGSGKSTLAKLVPRFYDVGEGAVLVDGVDVRAMRQEELRARIGYVPQRAVLFSGTVADNIRFGAEGASDEEVRAAAATAQAADFVEAMDGGYGHRVAQGGTDLSGGQKQRLSIARALARKPDIYVFDDSFSALDFKTDAKLRAALKRETRGATVILVAQRIGTVMDADRIIVLEEGRVVGDGTHRELLAACPVYREIAASQLSEEELA
ncbi:MAG: ABC transporter ATP-binding protein, partial [Spirochaetaceae bacterium]|nr:ABC transporter ATP-binding protein [Spirochaetaceae bacterium]